MKGFLLCGAGLFALALAGCASQGHIDDVESTAEANQKILRENEHRLANLENSINALNTQVAQLNNRVYEVRTRTGQRTSMTVVPITGSTSSQPAKPAATPAARPQGRVINPAAKPAPLPAAAPKPAAPVRTASASGSVGQTPASAGPAGELGLPPAELPDTNTGSGALSGHGASAPVAANSARPTGEVVTPVPLVPASDLSLPPEHPSVSPIPGQASASTEGATSAAVAAPAARQGQTPARTTRAEESEYNRALAAARGGRTEEGIRLFREFLQKYPSGRYAANADYWIGECLYAQGKYQDALNQFNAVNSSFPAHHKNADALLKAGLTLSRLGDSAAAQDKYRAVLASFPKSEAAARVRAMGIR